MPVRIKIAKTATEMDELFLARHKVFVEEEGYLVSRAYGRIMDYFDAFPTTTNIITLTNDQVVGGIRITEFSPAGFPADNYFNFSSYLPRDITKIACVSQFFLLRGCRATNYRLGFNMMSMCAYWAYTHNMTHLVAAINPVIAPLCRLIGMEAVASEFFNENQGVAVLPMILDMKHIREPFLTMIKRQGGHEFLENYDREFYKAGETIMGRDKEPGTDYSIIDGNITAYSDHIIDGKAHQSRLAELGPGQIFRQAELSNFLSSMVYLKADTKVELMPLTRNHFTEKKIEKFGDVYQSINSVSGLPKSNLPVYQDCCA